MKKLITIIIILVFLISCATAPHRINPTYVSPIQYKNYSCSQLYGESKRVSDQLAVVSKLQQNEATKDAVGMGIGMILFAPALLLLIGTDRKEEVARLKGERDAIRIALIKCEGEVF